MSTCNQVGLANTRISTVMPENLPNQCWSQRKCLGTWSNCVAPQLSLERSSNRTSGGTTQQKVVVAKASHRRSYVMLKNIAYILSQHNKHIAYVLPDGSFMCFYHIFLLSPSIFVFWLLQPRPSKGHPGYGSGGHVPNPRALSCTVLDLYNFSTIARNHVTLWNNVQIW